MEQTGGRARVTTDDERVTTVRERLSHIEEIWWSESMSRLNPFYYIISVINALVVFHCQSCVADISGVSILVLYFTSMVTYLVCHTCCLDYLRACVCHMRTTRDLSRVSYRLLL